MGNQTLVYKAKVQVNLQECYRHLARLNEAFEELEKKYRFPIDADSYVKITNSHDIAFSDQAIYRFSKLQDTMGAKLFKSFLLYQGENIHRPFLDILNTLERVGILEVEMWFVLRDLRNEIAHNYEDDEKVVIEILNTIYEQRSALEQILDNIKKLID